MAGARPAHLGRRGAIYFVRYRVPVDLAEALGMAEFRRSLHTSDPRAARERCLAATAWFRATVEQLRRMKTPTRQDLEQAATEHFRQIVAAADVPRHFNFERLDEEVDINVEASLARAGDMDDQLRVNVFDRRVQLAAEDIVQRLGANWADLDAGQRLFAQQLAARAERTHHQLFAHRLRTPAAAFKGDDLLFTNAGSQIGAPPPVHIRPSAAAPVHAGGSSLSDLSAEYLRMKEQRGVGPSQIDEVGRLLDYMKQEFGAETPVGDVRKEQLRAFRNDIQRLNSSLPRQAIPFRKRLTDVPKKRLKGVTALRYWKSIQAFFAWCAAEGHIDLDPASGLKMTVPKGEVRQSPEPFSQEELQRLFKSPLYSGYLKPRRAMLPGDSLVREGRWWSGVLLLHTGLRAGELSQLLASDFVFDADIPHLKVREEDAAGNAGKTVKTASSVRDVPLHPDLLVLGLREFVELRAKRFPKERLFMEFRLGTRGKTSEGITRFWGDYLKKHDLWKAGRATHVFRHTVTACLRRNGLSDADIGPVLGHSPETITGTYGGGYPLGRKYETLLRLDHGIDVVAAVGGPYDPKRHR